MRIAIFFCAGLLCTTALARATDGKTSPPKESPPSPSDARAVEIGKAMWSALGGDAGWSHARYFRFDFVVDKGGKTVASRAHYWDRFTGRYRVDSTEASGARASVFFDVSTRAGQAFVDGKRVADAAAEKKRVEDGYEAFINDTYWLLAPYKIFDPGVSLTYAGEEKGPTGAPCDVLKLSFAGVGLTPKDVYWFYVDRGSHLMTQWKYVLDGKSQPPTVVAWNDWKSVGPIRLSMAKPMAGKPVSIRFENVAVSDQVDEKSLTPPR